MIPVRRLKDVDDFIKSLPDYDAAICNRYTELLKEHAWRLKDPYTEHTEGVFILRPSGKGGEYRIFYAFVDGTAYLVHAIHKKTKKLNRADIELAKSRIAMVKQKRIVNC